MRNRKREPIQRPDIFALLQGVADLSYIEQRGFSAAVIRVIAGEQPAAVLQSMRDWFGSDRAQSRQLLSTLSRLGQSPPPT